MKLPPDLPPANREGRTPEGQHSWLWTNGKGQSARLRLGLGKPQLNLYEGSQSRECVTGSDELCLIQLRAWIRRHLNTEEELPAASGAAERPAAGRW